MRPDPLYWSWLARGDMGSALPETLVRIGRAIESRLTSELEREGLNPRGAELLMVLAKNPGLNQQELARVLGINPSSVAWLVHRLEDLGFVSPTRGHPGARGNRRAPTVEALAALERLACKRRSLSASLDLAIGSRRAQELSQLAAIIELDPTEH